MQRTTVPRKLHQPGRCRHRTKAFNCVVRTVWLTLIFFAAALGGALYRVRLLIRDSSSEFFVSGRPKIALDALLPTLDGS